MHKTVAIIPARGGSKRFPGKNICLFRGLPLLAHSILYALNNKDIISQVYVSTDQEEIKKVAVTFGAKVIDRPDSISGDFSATVTAVQHALHAISDTPDNIVLLQPTNPLREEKLLREAFENFLTTKSSSLMTVSPIDKKVGRIKESQYFPVNYSLGQRSQDLESLFFENGLLYITRKDLILEGKIFGEDGIPYITTHPFSTVDIDTEEDLEYAEWILKRFSDEA